MKYGRWLVSVVVVLLVVYAASKVDWRAAAATLQHATLVPLLAAIVINLVSDFFRGIRWWVFLRALGPVPLSLAVRGAVIGSGFNNLVVANGGDATRALLVARATGASRTSIVATLALERIFDPICFGLLLFTATFIVPLPPQLSGARPVVGIALIAVAGVLTLLARSPLSDDEVGTAKGWRARLREFRKQVQTLSTPGRFVGALGASIVVWLLQLATFALVARSVGIGLPLAGSVAALLLTNTGLVLRATPGNVGYFQFAYAVAAARFGVATEPAVASALLLQVVQIAPVTLLALALAPRLLRSPAK